MEVEYNHLNHATWECKYHVVFTPKYRKKLLFGKIKRHLGQVFHDLARRKECRIEEGHLMPDHVHMLISIPPKYSVAQIIGYMKGKSSIWIAQHCQPLRFLHRTNEAETFARQCFYQALFLARVANRAASGV